MKDVEDRLSRYRPAGPPLALRQRVIAAGAATESAQPQPRVQWWRWLPAAAAALVAIVFYTLSAGASADVVARLSANKRAYENTVAELTSRLGGDEAARQEANRLLELDEHAADTSALGSGAGDIQVTSHD